MAHFFEDTIEVPADQCVQPFTEERLGFLPGNLYMTPSFGNVRFFYLGGDPDTQSGHRLTEGVPLAFLKTPQIIELRMISEAGTARVTVSVSGV